MTPEYIISIAQKAMQTTVVVAAPMLVTSMVFGLLIAIFQTATQINEMTLTFVPKIIAVFVVIIIFFPWMLRTMSEFLMMILINIPNYTF